MLYIWKSICWKEIILWKQIYDSVEQNQRWELLDDSSLYNLYYKSTARAPVR